MVNDEQQTEMMMMLSDNHSETLHRSWDPIAKAAGDRLCSIEEDVDLYGFSFVKSMHQALWNESGPKAQIDDIHNHENWHNMKSVELMMGAYHLDSYGRTKKSEFSTVSLSSLQGSIADFQSERFVIQGRAYLMAKNFAKALLSFERALQVNPRCIPAMLYRIEISMNAGDLRTAHAEVRKVLEVEPANADALRLLQRIPSTMPDTNRDTSQGRKFVGVIDRLQQTLHESEASHRQMEKQDGSSKSTSSSSSDTSDSESDDSSSRKRKRRRKDKDKKKKKDKHKKKKKHKRHRKD